MIQEWKIRIRLSYNLREDNTCYKTKIKSLNWC